MCYILYNYIKCVFQVKILWSRDVQYTAILLLRVETDPESKSVPLNLTSSCPSRK